MRCITCNINCRTRLINLHCINCDASITRCIGCRRAGVRYSCNVCFSPGY